MNLNDKKDATRLRMRHDVLHKKLKQIQEAWEQLDHVERIHSGIDTLAEAASINVTLKNKTKYYLFLKADWVEDDWILTKIETKLVERSSLKKVELFNQWHATNLESVFAQIL